MKPKNCIARWMRPLMLALAIVAMAAPAVRAQIVNTVHNLSATGRSGLRRRTRGDGSDLGVCIYCHTPHNATPSRALWNRDLPAVTYRLYQSSTMKAQVLQPTGSSRLCLSCHDGILAVSNIRMTPGNRKIANIAPLTGSLSLGVDLSDDHPISFLYDSALALRDGRLADPSALPRTAPLDDRKQLQCTSCHDPHLNTVNFLRIDEASDTACTVCHRQRDWQNSAHAHVNTAWHAGVQKISAQGGIPGLKNSCLSCHRVHNAPHPQRLLAQTVEEQNCTVCHNGTTNGGNLETEFMKPSSHPIHARQWVHDPNEDPFVMPRHVTCVDCHNPHAASASASATRSGRVIISGPLRGVSGLSIAGARVKEARFEYEVCLKCHGVNEPMKFQILRHEASQNLRYKIGPSAMSNHAIAAPSRNRRITGLLAPYNSSSVLTCTECHNSDQWQPGSKVPRGPHGSRFAPILAAEYDTVDPSPESYSSYSLCYKCHDRGMILFGGGISGFPHKKHVVDNHTSCAVCHDPHGSRQSQHLINFMVASPQGIPVARPAKNGRLDYVPDPGRPGHGKCYVTCHGTEHNGTAY